jgi:midasin (ATPase involved in ribosome maturation)
MAKSKKTPSTILGQKKNIKMLELAIEKNLPTLLVGETGTGKTSVVEELAEKHGAKMIRVNLNGQSGTDEIIGKYLLKAGKTYWIDGALTEAMRKGDWILFDEINASTPEILFAMHSLLDHGRHIKLSEKDGEVVKPHPNFRFFASMNPPSVNYSGTKDLNGAFISRFPIITRWDYPSNITEAKILQARYNVNLENTTNLIRLAKSLRTARKNDQIIYICSTRDLLDCCRLLDAGLLLPEAFEMAILNKIFDPTEKTLVESLFKEFCNITIPESIAEKNIDDIVEQFAELEKQTEKIKVDFETKEKSLNDMLEKLQGVLSNSRA